MTNIIDRSPQKQFIKSAVFTTATGISLMPILNSREVLFSSIVILPLAVASTSSQDFKKTRIVTSVTSGLLISDQLLPSSKNPYLNITKTAAIVGLIYLALSPSKDKRTTERDNLAQMRQNRRNFFMQSFFSRPITGQNQTTDPNLEPQTTRHNPMNPHRTGTANPLLQGRREQVGSR